MRAVVVTALGGPEVLRVQEVEPPAPGPDDLVVDVEACGVNFLDAAQRRSGGASAPPFVVGLEGAGRVRATGSRVTGVSVGDRVAWPLTPASSAEQVRVPAAAAIPVPDAVSSEAAAAVIAQGLTAHYLATDCYVIAEGDDVLVHAAAGGVGSLLVQIASRRGARVFGTVSSEAKADTAKRAGAEVLGYDDFDTRVRELTDGKGVEVVYDGVGEATFDRSLASVARRGYLVCYGKSSGPVAPLDIGRLGTAGSVYLARPHLADFLTSRDETARRSGELFQWIADGELRVEISGRYSFEEAAEAHAALEKRRSTGKLLLIP